MEPIDENLPPKRMSQRFLASLLLGFTVVGGYLAEHFVLDLRTSVILVIAGLVALAIVLMALLSSASLRDVLDDFQYKCQRQISEIVDSEFRKREGDIRRLRVVAEQLELVLQCGLSNSPLSKTFLSAAQIEQIELRAQKEVIVVTTDLVFDEQIRKVVQEKARGGVRYIYLMPDQGVNRTAASDFLADDPGARKNLEFFYLKDFHFPLDMVVYDPGRDGQNGYLCIPKDPSTPLPKAIRITDNQHLRTAASCLISIANSLREAQESRTSKPHVRRKGPHT